MRQTLKAFLPLVLLLALSGCAETQPLSSDAEGYLNRRIERKMAKIAASRDKELDLVKRMMGESDAFGTRHPDKAWDWFCGLRADFETKFVPIDYREKSLFEAKTMMRTFSGPSQKAAWRPVGPTPPNGRIADLAVDPKNPNVIYVASASGGIWKTTDQGRQWANLTDNKLPSLGIGCLLLDPTNPQIIYAGLGEGTLGGTYEPLGTGVYKSSDGGQTWSLTPGSGNNALQVVTRLDFGPNPATIYAACLGVQTAQGLKGAGLFVTADGGQTWSQSLKERAWSISVSPQNRSELLVSTMTIDPQARQLVSKVLLSTDGGRTFTETKTPAQDKLIRISLARSQSQPGIVYALVGGADSGLAGVWKSQDGGRSWQALPLTGIPMGDKNEAPAQMYYNNCLAVCPTDPNLVVFGTNLTAYKTTDGGQTWKPLTYWWAPNDKNLPYLHADHHAFVFGPDCQTIYAGTDGGFALTTDGGRSWQERNEGLLITQIYRVANSATNESHILIGCQDNSCFVKRPDGKWQNLRNFGDGMEVIIDPGDDKYVYGTNYYGLAAQFSPAGGLDEQAWLPLRLIQNWHRNNNGIPDNEQGAWVAPFILDPLKPEDVYLCLVNVYKTTVTKGSNQAPRWQKIFGGLESQGRPITMEVMRLTHGPQNRKLILFALRGSDRGLATGLFRMNLDGSQPEQLQLPRMGMVGDIAADPKDNNVLWLGYANVGVGAHNGPRVYKSADLGRTWVDKTGQLPQHAPVNAIFIDPQNPRTIILGTDVGAFRSDDDGGSWYEYSQGLPNVVITDFAYFPPKRLLRAATYGRGLWETALAGGPGGEAPPAATPGAPGGQTEQLRDILKRSKTQ